MSELLAQTAAGYRHWCPGCKREHVIPSSWIFDGNYSAPTFTPSVRITYNGPDAGRRRRGGQRAPASCCHYLLTRGQLTFCTDSTHELAGKTVPLPELLSQEADQ